MQELTAKIVWIDSTEDFIEINFKVANEKLSAIFSGYTSIQEIKKLWGNDLVGRLLLGKKLQWDMQGSLRQSISISGELSNPTGIIELVFHIVYAIQEDKIPVEECVVRIKIEPNQLDTFCKQFNNFKGKTGEFASLEI